MSVDASTLAARLADVQVLDVRYPNEWDAGRIHGARHIPLDDLEDRVDEVDRDRPVVTVCRSGDRSGRAAEWLRGEGVDAENLDGGMQAWADSGLPVTAEGGATGTVAEPEEPPSELSPELERLQSGFLELVFAVQERFGDREPTEEELRGFLRDRLLSEGRSPEEADQVLASIGGDSVSSPDRSTDHS